MPVCIAGMHRSGTSMVARLILKGGLFLGEDSDLVRAESDNPDGYFEHSRFLSINERILEIFEGGWDMPPTFPAGWTSDPRLDPLRVEAKELVASFPKKKPWG